MKNATRVLAALVTAVGLATAVPVSAADANPVGTDCDASYMTAAEFGQVDVGARLFRVKQIVGGPGVRLPDQSSTSYLVRQWDWCTDGAYYANQWLVFERNVEGRWVVSEIR